MWIGELAEVAGTTAKTLRFYEDQGLLPPTERTSSGYRDYTPEAVARIDFIHRGQAAGLTLAQIRQILDIRDHGQAPCGHVRDLLDARLTDIEQQMAHLIALRDNIAALRNDAAQPEPDKLGSRRWAQSPPRPHPRSGCCAAHRSTMWVRR